MCMSALFGFSQTRFINTSSNPTGAITNTSADTCYYTTSRSYAATTVQIIVTKATGTMAGTSVLAMSVDGVNYVNVDTLTNTNVTVNTGIFVNQSAARYWRVITGGATTVTGTVTAYISASSNQ